MYAHAPFRFGVAVLILICNTVSASDGTGSARHSLFSVDGDAQHDNFGSQACFVGDINRDGFDDFAAGASHSSFGDRGYVRVFSGSDGVELYTFIAEEPEDSFGLALAGGLDVNNDGYDDIIVGAQRASLVGHVRIFSGATGDELYRLVPPEGSSQFGFSVAALGDINGDGLDDFIVGHPKGHNDNIQVGQATIYSGDGSELFVVSGDADQDRFGWSVSSAGDVNADGTPDFVVGTSKHTIGGVGYARVFSGADASVLFTKHGDAIRDHFGGAVSGAGDVNGDGYDDVIVSATQASMSADPGYVRVFAGPNGTELYTLRGDAGGDRFGEAISSIGDINGDGLDDIIAGAPRSFGRGYVRLFSGDGATLRTLVGDPGDRIGQAVDGGYDINRDEVLEILVGVPAADNAATNTGTVHLLSTEPLPLATDQHLVSLSEGGNVAFCIDAGNHSAGLRYLLVGSKSGISPGFVVDGFTIPLNVDSYFEYTHRRPNQAPLSNSLGFLDDNGQGNATFTVPPQSNPALVGLTLHHAYAVFQGGSVVFVSNPAPVTLVQ